MITKYVKREETIILAVVPANVDIVTTEALQMAKEVDPKGERTLGKRDGKPTLQLFEFAMQMELDGEKFYRELAEKTDNTGLKNTTKVLIPAFFPFTGVNLN